jgi:hypothetical protein
VAVAVTTKGVSVAGLAGATGFVGMTTVLVADPVALSGKVVVIVPAASARTRLGIASVATELSFLFPTMRKNMMITLNAVSQIFFIVLFRFPNAICFHFANCSMNY